uniref:Enoyl-CoA hydratase n=1 Tax=Spongospora subterranea TaxID=70186 RepID=A0A0H5R782_9EUKA|eukprot:CRZ09681.1 hypothetical protein [Spongospora subterranea]
MDSPYPYKNGAFAVEPVSDTVSILWLNCPKRLNSMGDFFWSDLSAAMDYLNNQTDARVVVLAAKGIHFSAGLDVKEFSLDKILGNTEDVGRRAATIQLSLKLMQNSFSQLESSRFPVIAAIHGACLGGALDLICAADIRICTTESVFSIMEVHLSMAADLGTLQRLPKIIGSHSFVREAAFTGRKFSGSEAYRIGLCSKLIDGDHEAVLQEALQLAGTIASKSPLAVATTKQSLNYSREHCVQDGLDYIAALNGAALQTKDFMAPPPFAKL